MELTNVICPISGKKIDSNLSRTTVFLNVLLMAAFIFSLEPIFIFIVSIDYFIRAFVNIKYSPIRIFALFIVRLVKLEKKPIDIAQKIFASRLGFICAAAALLLIAYELTTFSIIVAGVLMVLSIMDSVLNFCVGCLIYNYLVYPFYTRRK